MDTAIKSINKNEILKNLQYRGSEIPEDIDELINSSIIELKENSKPKYIYKEFNKNDEILKEILLGKDIENLLSTSQKIILMAVTLGGEIEMLIRKYSFSNLTKSIILDAVASAGVESLTNDLNEDLINKYSPLFLTDRFSPGYGDMPISVQKKFIEALETGKNIGLTTTNEGIMIPRKSITAIIGISNEKQNHRHRGCEMCRLYMECEFIKKGETCGYDK